MEIFDILLDILLKPPQPFIGLFLIMSQGVCVIPWKVLGPGNDNSESINTLKVYCP